jgi:predicted Zn-dependent protease
LLRIRAAAARYPGDPLAARTLAHLELLYGDPAAADRLLDPLIQANPNDAFLLYLKGLRWITADNSENPPPNAAAQARQWLERARALDDTHYPTLFRLAESRRGDDDYVSENTAALLERAQRLAPQIPNITLSTASILIALGRGDEAVRLLRPLALSPHDGGIARSARMLMEQAGTRGRPPADDEDDGGDSDAPAGDKPS